MSDATPTLTDDEVLALLTEKERLIWARTSLSAEYLEILALERKRADAAEAQGNAIADAYAEAVKACTGVVPRTGPDSKIKLPGGTRPITQRPLVEMVTGLAADLDAERALANKAVCALKGLKAAGKCPGEGPGEGSLAEEALAEHAARRKR